MTFKFTAIAAAAIATLATTASADSFFSYQRNLDSQSTLELGTVVAQGNGVIELYDFRGGSTGALLGTESVNAGANTNVRINVGDSPEGDVLAVLTVGGEAVAQREYIID